MDVGLRDEAPVHYCPESFFGPYWSITRYKEIVEVETSHEIYSSEHAITIAVMGCRVNGPGETDDADLGLWCGPSFVNLKRGETELGAFPYDQILPRLKSELDGLIAERTS